MEGLDPGEDPAAWYSDRHGVAPGYSALLDALTRTPAERRAILHSLFEPTEEERDQGLKLPTAAHRAVAELVAAGFVKVVITTNFDRLMETALNDAGVVPTVISTADGVRGAAPLVHQRCVVLKVHGDYLDDRIMNTDAELASYDPAMSAYLDRVFDEFGLVVCGWSGEWDPALRAAVERCPSRRYATYWTGMGEPNQTVANLMQLRDARFIRIPGADEFMSDLRDKVISLEELASPGPLSVGAAVASVKRFVAEPRYRIRLDDLLGDEVKRAQNRHADGMRLDSDEVTTSTIRQRFHGYDASMEALAAMLFNAARWADPPHHDIVRRTIASLVPPDRAGGYDRWIEMQRYPAILAFYAACAGAMSSGKFALLKQLCDMKVRANGRSAVALPDLSAAYFNDNTARQLYDQALYTPLSRHLSRTLRPLVASADTVPERAFDRLEVMLALLNLERTEDPAKKAYLLLGMFSWRHEDPAYTEIFDEAGAAGDDWPPLRDGLFRGSAQRFERVRDGFLINLGAASHRR
ncbi:SIR2 family protein [Aureimonas phyllosphaerae]|uniref:SIR2-like domain-containing protein n=1 Tax=Aureimonas phyllosphaerae TaxID=1166078 RepID=A0A7W6BY80_9HYPH|nr:SIR2 family protein [Aureimonas phyllosphaerae]MBB3937333.1 hypothetical protein [Aureimonas phyllosphaerae]MBB3961340.1 hypothetical protein [Aureimonas phyllosphaerae]